MKRMSRILGLVLAASFLAFGGVPPLAAYAADTRPPAGTIIINNNRSATNNTTVSLALTWDDGSGGSGVSRMRFSDDGAHWTAWETLAATRAYILPSGDGHKTVRVQFLDKANNRSAVFSDYIRLDTTPPTGTIVINGGAATTTTQLVSLGLTWDDGAGSQVSRMRFSDDGQHWTPWETPTATRAHTLPKADLTNQTVRMQCLDGAGNYSEVCNDYIKLVATPYVGTTETVLLPGNVGLVLVWIPGGTFMMGSPDTEQDRQSWEGPQHSVTLGGFWMGKYELTKRQWQAVMDSTPWSGEGWVLGHPDSPAVFVSWNDAQSFLTAVNSHTGKTFRLPSEAEWEYACRGGKSSRFYWGDDPSYTAMGYYAWYYYNAYYFEDQRYAHLVGIKTGNAFGLYDMSGNAAEWCEDDWHDNYTGAPTGGQAWVDSPRTFPVYRGGTWRSYDTGCRSAYRNGNYPDTTSPTIGFRVVR